MYEENVRRGMQFLDERRPGWLWRVDLATLNLAANCKCVLGQLEGEYFRGCANFGFDWDGTNSPQTFFAHEHGFHPSASGDCSFRSPRWKTLTATWRRLILEAREQRKLTTAAQPLESETERVLQTAN